MEISLTWKSDETDGNIIDTKFKCTSLWKCVPLLEHQEKVTNKKKVICPCWPTDLLLNEKHRKEQISFTSLLEKVSDFTHRIGDK